MNFVNDAAVGHFLNDEEAKTTGCSFVRRNILVPGASTEATLLSLTPARVSKLPPLANPGQCQDMTETLTVSET